MSLATAQQKSHGEPASHPADFPITPFQRFGVDALHVASLNSLVIAQSFYERLAQQAEYLIDPSVTPQAIVWMVVSLSVGLPVILIGIEAIAGWFSRRCRESVHLGVVLLYASLILLQLLHQVEFLPGWLTVLLGLGLGCGLTWSYSRFSGLRSVVTLASLGIVMFPAILYARLNAAESNVSHRAVRDPTRPPVPVVMVVFDEFCGASLMTPQREIDAIRFPNFFALQQESTWYRSAASVSPTTIRALPSILTGNFTQSNLNKGAAFFPQNLFSLLSAAGKYDIVAFEPLSVLAPGRKVAPPRSHREVLQQSVAILSILGRVYLYEIAPSDFHRLLPAIPQVWFGLHDSKLVDRLARRGTFRYGWTDRRDQQLDHFLECIDETPESVLYFGHFLIPHAPWCYFPSGTRYASDRDDQDRLCLGEDSNLADELGLIQNQQRHLLQVMYVDQQVGRLTERLKEVGIWDECLLIVTADHGVSFRLGEDRREYTAGNAEDILSIPLFIKYPGQQSGEVNDLPVQSIDFLPTVLEQIGIQPAIPLKGRSAKDRQVAQRTMVHVRDVANELSFPSTLLQHTTVPTLIRRRFGSGTDRWNLFRIGPHPEWLGRSLKEFSINAKAPLDLECVSATLTSKAVDLSRFPYHIKGRVVAPTALNRPVELIAVVDGVICGTTRTYHQFGFTERWEVMLPEWSYSGRATTPEFYFVNPDDGSLSPCVLHWVEKLGEFEPESDER